MQRGKDLPTKRRACRSSMPLRCQQTARARGILDSKLLPPGNGVIEREVPNCGQPCPDQVCEQVVDAVAVQKEQHAGIDHESPGVDRSVEDCAREYPAAAT